MVQGISSSYSVSGITFPSSVGKAYSGVQESLNSFDLEDKAIISAQAKMMNELEKYNSGEGNEVDLALTTITSQREVEAQAAVINSKKQMFDSILDIVND